jgi:hypothetical protein
MGLALTITLLSAIWTIWNKAGYIGIGGLIAFALVVFLGRRTPKME